MHCDWPFPWACFLQEKAIWFVNFSNRVQKPSSDLVDLELCHQDADHGFSPFTHSNAHILTAWEYMSSGETLNTICQSAFRSSCRNQAGINKATCHMNDHIRRTAMVIQNPPNLIALSRLVDCLKSQSQPTRKTMPSTYTLHNPILWRKNLTQSRQTQRKQKWTKKIQISRDIARLGTYSVTMQLTPSSVIWSIFCGNYFIALETSNRPWYWWKPNIASNNVIATPKKTKSRFPSTFHTSPDELPVEATFVPLLCQSGEPLLVDFCHHNNTWLFYLTIGKIRATIRNQYSYHMQPVDALLLVLPQIQHNVVLMTKPGGIYSSGWLEISPRQCWCQSHVFLREEISILVLCG